MKFRTRLPNREGHYVSSDQEPQPDNPSAMLMGFCYDRAMQWIVGIDEVGRGPLAGPVCVCAVAMPKKDYTRMRWIHNKIPLTDSKKMTALSREVWERYIRLLEADAKVRIGLSMKSAGMIDRYGISTCIKSCIQQTLKQLNLDPKDCTIMLDGGLKAPEHYKNQTTVIRGDLIHPIISCAAVVAKVRRDALMRRLHKNHTQYAWHENKGYGTRKHRLALQTFGASPIHRKSFISKVISA